MSTTRPNLSKKAMLLGQALVKAFENKEIPQSIYLKVSGIGGGFNVASYQFPQSIELDMGPIRELAVAGFIYLAEHDRFTFPLTPTSKEPDEIITVIRYEMTLLQSIIGSMSAKKNVVI